MVTTKCKYIIKLLCSESNRAISEVKKEPPLFVNYHKKWGLFYKIWVKNGVINPILHFVQAVLFYIQRWMQRTIYNHLFLISGWLMIYVLNQAEK
jgi:hypothetical protein